MCDALFSYSGINLSLIEIRPWRLVLHKVKENLILKNFPAGIGVSEGDGAVAQISLWAQTELSG